MSKHFGGGGGGRRVEPKEYATPRRGVEDKRPSVFDRLGVRKYEDSVQSSHYGGSDRAEGNQYRRSDGSGGGGGRKHSPMHSPVMGRRRSQDTRERIRSRSRSRSYSPRSRKTPSESSHHHVAGHSQIRRGKGKELSPHRKRSNSPVRRKDKSGGDPKWREEGVPRHKNLNTSGSKKKSGKRSGKKKEKKVKGRSSSGSSGTTQGTSSSSRSVSSSSSSSEASSSSTSNASSSSDSSVPSIKLKHESKKRKKIKRPSSKSESVSTGQVQSRISSGSSIDSANVRDNQDLREKIKAKNRRNYERMHEGTPQRRPPDSYSSASGGRNMREESPRRRRPSGASSSFEDKPLKRRRMLSPEEFVPSPRRAPPPNEPLRRERSPVVKNRIRVIQSPMRRAPIEDNRRGGDMKPHFGEKPREMDRYRDEPHYSRDNRQKERVAPARMLNPRHQMTPDRDQNKHRPGINRFETRGRPLLQLPHTNPVEPQKPPFRPQEDRLMRTNMQPGSPVIKHSPMIVKSKEALIEKYRGMKQSQYVDMWVDKTVEACNTPASTTRVITPSPKSTPPPPQKVFEEATERKGPAMQDMNELLSDFSDDADELLNDVHEDAKSEASVKSQEKLKVQDEAVTEEKKIVPVVSSDRKSVDAPQRSFVEPGAQSLPSRSQTEDDILERMDFEEISDEELGDVPGENKIPIVDALGVDWASLVCGERNRPVSPNSATQASTTLKVRRRWTPIQVISRVGLVNNCSERLLQKVVHMKMREDNTMALGDGEEEDPTELEEKIQDELQNTARLRKIRARANVIDTIGLGSNSRALSSRRDMALRRYYLGMPQKSLVSMDVLHQSSASGVQDLDSIGELYRLSLSLFKGSESAAVAL